jgi:hypothetical protein
MSLFRKLFKKSGSKQSPDRADELERSKYMPDLDSPIDERFTQNFIFNGGKFLYGVNMNDIHTNFDNILLENDWYEQDVLCLDTNLTDIFKGYNLNFGTQTDSSFFLTTCESLVADNGSLLVCSKQLKEMKLQELPRNMVVYATTSQIVQTIGEGLRIIKNTNKGSIPTNITAIKHFENTHEEKNFMTYGSSTKNLYLLLLEDL